MTTDISSIKKIAVIGAGQMGPGMAQVFAYKGYPVNLYARREEARVQALETARANLKLMAEWDIVKPEDIEPSVARIKTTGDLEEAVADADFVMEAIAENLAVKHEFFVRMEKACPDSTILATNTSVISITEVAQKCRLKERVVGTHFWNPPHLIPLVEVVRGDETSDKTMDITMALMWAAGKHPLRVNKDAPGFVCNRLQHALWREAISIVEHGIATAAEVDEALKFGVGIRLPVLAPMETADMGGLDLTLAIHDYILKYLEDSHESSPLLREKVAKGELGFKTGGVGFQTWTPEEQAAVRKRLAEHLLKWTKEHQE